MMTMKLQNRCGKNNVPRWRKKFNNITIIIIIIIISIPFPYGSSQIDR